MESGKRRALLKVIEEGEARLQECQTIAPYSEAEKTNSTPEEYWKMKKMAEKKKQKKAEEYRSRREVREKKVKYKRKKD